MNDLDPVWMARARREIGVKEVAGTGDHPRILQYLAATKIGPRLHHDATPWCSAYVCWVMEETDLRSTRSAAARSWLTWGDELKTPRPGCIVVFSRPTKDNPNSGHVGFYVGEEDGKILVLGGNQANGVCVRPYDASRVLSYRWPSV